MYWPSLALPPVLSVYRHNNLGVTSNAWVVKLSWLENAYWHVQFYRPAIWTRKIGQGDLVCEPRLAFGSGSVRARSRSLCAQRLGLVPPWLFQNLIRAFWPPVSLKSRSNQVTLHPCQMHRRCKFVDCRPVAFRDNADIIVRPSNPGLWVMRAFASV